MNDVRLPIADDDAYEALLRDALSGAGRPTPFTVDVQDGVMARVAAFGPAARRELGPAQLRWWSAAAASIGVAVLTGTLANAPSLHELAAGAGRLAGSGVGAAAKAGLAGWSFARALGHAAWALVDAARAVIAPLAPLQPVAAALLSAVAACMLATTILVVARDFRAGGLPKEQA
jgi:hypothetical protein